jgi:hypothetical protein
LHEYSVSHPERNQCMPDRIVAMRSWKHNMLPEICMCGREAKVADGAISDVVEVELLEG